MANRFVLPLETPVDATGTPYAGAKLFFYANETTTKLDTYSDPGLTIANTNPVILDSAGRFPNAIFLQNRSYTVVLAPANDSDPPTAPIWSQDNVYTSDFSAAAQFASGNGSPNGHVAGTQGTATTLASVYWDYANNILYVCTSTGTSSTAVWTAVNASTAAAVVPSPQGYLTLTSGVPIIPSDVTAATTVYYTPYTGLLVPIYNGASFTPTSIVSELQLTLTSSHVASNIYDFFIFSLNGVVTLGTGPSWSAGTAGSITAGSCARGTGAGGTALTRLQGINVNAASMTVRYGNGTTTTTVAANQGTYVGSMYVDATNGQVSCYRGYGQSRKWGIWNAYNRNPISLRVGDSTASWVYSSTAIRESRGQTTNFGTSFTGLAEETVTVNFGQNATYNTGSGYSTASQIGIGLNSTSTFNFGMAPGVNSSLNQLISGTAEGVLPPALGINNFTTNEKAESGGTNFFGTETNMLMLVEWRG